MFHKLLVPVDGSEPSNAAISLALQLAREERASLIFAYVVEVNKIAAASVPVSMNPEFIFDAAQKAGDEILSDAKARAEQAGIAADSQLLEGDCVAAVLRFANESKTDLLVIGSHGRGGLSRALLGSVAEGIVRHSPIPVLVTHPGHALSAS